MTKLFGTLLLAIAFVSPQLVRAQEAAEAPAFKTEELDQMLAPIALYPDDLLSSVLMASTYPLEVVQAARWRKEPANSKLKGDALAKALEGKEWDPSVKSLAQFPDVLETMSEQLEWTQKLGDAFLAQQSDVMDRIQFLRQKAEAAGTLKSSKQQKVTKQTDYIVIEPAQPEVVYVPVYQPTVVYGSWWYPAYPPYYWYWGHPTSAFVSGFFWGAGFAVANSLWGWGRCDWNRRDIDIDINRYNNINVNRPPITSNKWQHNPAHRGPVPYKNKVTREKFGKPGPAKDARKDFRGFDKGPDGGLDKSKIGSRDVPKIGDGDGAKIKDKGRDLPKVGDGTGPKIKDRAADRPVAPDRKVSRDIERPAVKKPSPAAFDVKRGADVRRQADRGHASRMSMSGGPAARAPSRGGGGGAHRGGGGGGRGGGGRGGGGRR